MLLCIMRSEALKYKRTMIPWLIAACGFFPTFTALLYLLTSSFAVTWESLFYTSLRYMNMLSLLLAAIYAGYAFLMEYNGDDTNRLFIYPIPRIVFFFEKLTAVALVVLGSFLSFGISSAIAGFLFTEGKPVNPDFAIDLAGLLLLSSCANFALVPLTVLISLIAKKTGAYLLMGIGYFFCYMSFSGARLGKYIPPCIPDRLVTDYFTFGQIWTAGTSEMILVCAAVFFVTSCIGAVTYIRREI